MLSLTVWLITICAGLYAESHGMVDNYMYDEKHNTEFLMGENIDQYEPYWWDEGEPLWVTAKKQVFNNLVVQYIVIAKTVLV